MLEMSIVWVLTNFGFVLFLMALIIASLDKLQHPKKSLYEPLYKWIALLPLGINAIYAFIFHAFFPTIAAATIGWSNNPFQFEVAIANLAIGVVALISTYRNIEFRLATVITATIWLWGDAVGHIYQMLTAHNFAPGNAGSWFYLDVCLPLVLIVSLMGLRKRDSK